MPVTIDHQPLPADQLGLQTVGQVLAHLKQDNRLILNVLIDGKQPDLRRLKSLKKSVLADHVIQIETADPRKMASDVLDEVELQLNEADRLKHESTTLLSRNQFGPAVEKLGGCFSTWQHAHESILKTAQLLRIDPERIKVHGRALTDLLIEFTSHLRQIRAALEGRDFAALGELLADKMSRACEQWRDAIRSFRGVLVA